ncbi:helix-turn-helix domain-containing protein [Azonexus sp.]|jgi:DNA-binding IclR family transcriptional regulator|uniref:helix-turn-helix domain-containing protein n=1 Tax=Azonexus sp. TaxID=1872668 RepID=UPI0028180844|nr:helix-turn-helix domain-containing protein [Azonexus sp.]MDR1995134.1 MarR family transcriptional regulator [Azonexus sp.]
MTTSKTAQSAGKVLDVLAALLGHFANGLTATDLSKITGLDPSAITRYVATLEEKGFAERIPETGRIRPSVHIARHAVSILRGLDAAEERLQNIKQRLTN